MGAKDASLLVDILVLVREVTDRFIEASLLRLCEFRQWSRLDAASLSIGGTPDGIYSTCQGD